MQPLLAIVNRLAFTQQIRSGSLFSTRTMPTLLYLFVVNSCPSNCIFCPYGQKTSERMTMSFETFRKALDEYVLKGGEWVDFTPVAGDPLVDVNLFEKIHYARQAGINKISFATNGILLNKRENWRSVIDCGVDWLVLSTPGLDRDAYKRIFRVDAYDDVISGLQNLAEYKVQKDGKTDIAISMRLDRPLEQAMKEDGVKEIKKYIDSGVIRFEWSDCVEEMHNWSGQIAPEKLPGTMRLKSIPPKPMNLPCEQITNAAILPNGKLRTCACRYYETEFDDLVIGDIQNSSLETILRSRPLLQLTERMMKGDWPRACQDCSYYHPWLLSDRITWNFVRRSLGFK